MVVAFVGFVGGWTREIFGPDMLPLAGAAGASVATLFTFLPSFLFILICGPAVEATRGDVKFTAPLTGICGTVQVQDGCCVCDWRLCGCGVGVFSLFLTGGAIAASASAVKIDSNPAIHK